MTVTATMHYQGGLQRLLWNNVNWFSQNPAVASAPGLDAPYLVNLLSPGSTSIGARGLDKRYEWDPVLGECVAYSIEVVDDGPIQVTVTAPPPPPQVEVTEANIVEDRIVVNLSPAGASGWLLLTVDGEGPNPPVYDGPRGGGTHTFTFNRSSLAFGQYTSVTANWFVPPLAAQHSRPGRFFMLGSYLHTRYNTPIDDLCTGPPVEYHYTSGGCLIVSSCEFAGPETAPDMWWMEVAENGSGYSNRLQTVLSREGFCSGHPRRARRVPAPCPSCQNETVVTNLTVARRGNHPHLPCGATVFVEGVGVRIVTDTGGGLAMQQLDHYAGISGCNREGGTIGYRVTIRLDP